MKTTSQKPTTNPERFPFSSCLGKFLACGLLSGVLAASQLLAATVTIVSDDFESYTGAATSLSDTSDADPAVPNGVIADDDPVGGVAGSGVQLINWLAHSGSQSLLVRSGSEAQLNLPDTRSGSSYTLDYWMHVVREPTSDRNFYLIVGGMGADNNGSDVVAFIVQRSAGSTVWQYFDGVGPGAGAWVSTPANQAPGTWQHHRFVIDANALTFTLYIDDMNNPVVSGVDLARPDSGLPTRLVIRNEGNSADDGYFAIDDITLTVENPIDLTTTFTENFESYPARVNVDDDADPLGPWVTVESDGTSTARLRAPGKVQVVDSATTGIPVRPGGTGSKFLKLEGGQRAGATIAWGVTPQSDVQITWWARVPASVVTVGTEANYLRMSLYGAENGNCLAGDNALLGYGIRSATVGDATSLTYYAGNAWFDSGKDYTPDTWEQYRLTTHTAQGKYTIIKNPDSANPEVVVDRGPFIGTATNWFPVFMAAWSSSNGTNHPPVYIDDIEIKSLVANAPELGDPYTVTFHGTRFTNVTELKIGGGVGKAAVDPRDNSTIVFAMDTAPGGIYRATKVASGNWVVDPTPLAAGLDRPSGLTVDNNGTIWWTHDYSQAVMRLKAPWDSNTPETLISYFGDPAIDDDPIDLAVAPDNFNGGLGQPGMIVIADRGSDGDAFNALNLLDRNTTELNQTNTTFLVPPTTGLLGGGNLNAITALPAYGEVVALSEDGFITAVDANGSTRAIVPSTLWMSGPISAASIAADPTTGRLWIADDLLDEVWSVAADNMGVDQKELSFPVLIAGRPDQQIDVHDPGMAFAPNGSFMVITDTSVINGGGRLLIFHNESISLPNISITQFASTAQGFSLSWQSAGAAKYTVYRSTDIANPASWQDISGDLTATSYTDTNAPAAGAFYRVMAKP